MENRTVKYEYMELGDCRLCIYTYIHMYIVAGIPRAPLAVNNCGMRFIREFGLKRSITFLSMEVDQAATQQIDSIYRAGALEIHERKYYNSCN